MSFRRRNWRGNFGKRHVKWEDTVRERLNIFSKNEQILQQERTSIETRRRGQILHAEVHGGERKHGRSGFLIRSLGSSVEFGQRIS